MIQRREVAGGCRGEAWPRQRLCRGFRRPLGISYTPSARNLSGAREGLGASGEPQASKMEAESGQTIFLRGIRLVFPLCPVAGPGPL